MSSRPAWSTEQAPGLCGETLSQNKTKQQKNKNKKRKKGRKEERKEENSSDLGNSSIEVPSSQGTLGCVKVTVEANYDNTKGIENGIEIDTGTSSEWHTSQ